MTGSRGQSETLGYALILGFTLISVGAIAAFGGTTLQTTQEQIGVQNAENAMSQFDSRASMVALGQSDNQEVALGAGQQGTYTVDPEAGWIRIVHETANETPNEIYNDSLGVIRYRDGTREIGYQGGGVWRKDAASVMLSPPEFHYRGTTLTLPIVQIKGEGSVSGSPRATIRRDDSGALVFPNASADESWKNPVESGIVTVTVKSDYYDAWAQYFRTRTDGNVTENETNQTATLALVAPATHGDFDMPLEGNTMTLQGIQTHQVDEFTLSLIDDQDDEANFKNLDWSICAESGGQEFETQVIPNGTDDGDTAEATVYYSPNGSAYQTWTTEAFTFEAENASEGEDWNDDGDHNDTRLVLNLTSLENASYEQKNVNSFSNCGFDAKSFQSSMTFEGHEETDERNDYTTGSGENIKFIVNHYLALMGPTIDLEVADSNQNTVSEDISTGYLGYNATKNYYLTYMHVSENPINVTVG